MKILVLYNRVPFPLNDGGNIAVMALLKGLKEAGNQVHLLTMNTTRHYVAEDELSDQLSFLDKYDTIEINNDITLSGAVTSLFRRNSYHLSRFVNGHFRKKLVEILNKNQFDIIQMEGLFVTPYIPDIESNTSAPIVYRQHNIEYKIWKKNTEQANHPLKKWYLKILTHQLKKYELSFLRKIKYILPISYSDLKENMELGAKAEQLWIPFGIDDKVFQKLASPAPIPRKVYHIGAMDWLANQEGVKWFLKKVWPLILEKVPDASFHFAGRNMPDSFQELAKKYQNTYCTGEVKDAAAFEADKDILIVPVHSASGIRIKTLKALAHFKTVVSTSIGAQGLEAQPGKHFLIADEPNDFAQAVITLMKYPQEYQKLRNEGYHWVQCDYNNNKIIRKLTSFYEVIRK